MKLQYRGVSYEQTPATLPVAMGQVQGKFRGQQWATHNLKQDITLKPTGRLVYRGVEVQ
ncbi:MAG: DUF4278 domain-containing protein [Cyanobacteria bacterium P01_G01_bin.67]